MVAFFFDPKTGEETLLSLQPPQVFLDALRARGVPVSAGRCIVATGEPHQHAVLEAIRELGLELQIIFNKGAVMVLPAGVSKASGLEAALALLELSPHNVVGIGDDVNILYTLRWPLRRRRGRRTQRPNSVVAEGELHRAALRMLHDIEGATQLRRALTRYLPRSCRERRPSNRPKRNYNPPNAIDQAELNLRYCKVIAEIDGIVTRRNVNPGNNVLAGQSLMAIRSLDEIWIFSIATAATSRTVED